MARGEQGAGGRKRGGGGGRGGKQGAKGRGGPWIEAVLSTRPGAIDRPIKRVESGTTVKITGSGFGEDPGRVRVLFDEMEAPPFSIPFSDSSLLVTCPLPEKPTSTLSVRAGKTVSNRVRLDLRRAPGERRAPGAATRELLEAIDESAALTAALARRLAPGLPLGGQLRDGAAQLEALQKASQRSYEVFMMFLPIQAELTFEPLRAIERIDEVITRADLTGLVRRSAARVYGPGSPVAAMGGEGGTSSGFLFEKTAGVGGMELLSRAAESESAGLFGFELPSASQVLDFIGFLLHEYSKALEGAENVVKSIKLSASAGVVIAEGDVTFDVGELISAFAKFIDFISQILTKIGSYLDDTDAKIQGGIDRLEGKADAQGGVIAEIQQRTEKIVTELARQESKLDRTEEKSDRISEDLSRLEEKADRSEEKLDRLEQKADVQGELLGILEAKADRHEEKMDVLEIKADRHEQKLDLQESKADRAEQKLDAVEAKADRQEEKLDKLEEKADKAEEKLDKLEEKADRAEEKADRAEEKLDRLEEKADRAEEKLDREEEKLDRMLPPPPQEASVANQRGAASNVSAIVAAVRGPDNSVYVRAAIDVPRAALDDLSSWTPWVSFGTPTTTVQLVSVSVDLQYEEGSDARVNGLLTARDRLGMIYQRVYRGADHSDLVDPDEWSDWDAFLGQP